MVLPHVTVCSMNRQTAAANRRTQESLPQEPACLQQPSQSKMSCTHSSTQADSFHKVLQLDAAHRQEMCGCGPESLQMSDEVNM